MPPVKDYKCNLITQGNVPLTEEQVDTVNEVCKDLGEVIATAIEKHFERSMPPGFKATFANINLVMDMFIHQFKEPS